MRVTFAWVVAIALTLFLSSMWYIVQPLAISTFNISQDISEAGAWNTTGSGETYTLLTLSVNVMFPALILFVWLWALTYGGKTEDIYV